MEIPQSVCTLPKRGASSFYTAWKEVGGKDNTANMVPVSEKIALPASQENLNSDEKYTENTEKCPLCSRTFSSFRGKQQHLRSCKEKNRQHRENRNQSDQGQQSQSDLETQLATAHQAAAEIEEEVTQARNHNLLWGNKTSEELFQVVTSAYEEVVFWRKNLFKLPSGAAGKTYIKETTKLIEIWNEDKQPLSNIALKMVMLMPALLMQKPTRKSTAKQHSEYLRKRLMLWTEGKFDELMREGRAIQHKLKQEVRKDETVEQTAKKFANFMLQGKVHAALRLLDKAASLGVAPLSAETMKTLADLHPQAEPAIESVLQQGEEPYFDPVIFTNINEKSIANAALKTRGAAGPSGLDADGWKRILVSKNFGTIGKDLRTAIAKMTQTLCTQTLSTSPERSSSIDAYTANRLIPLLKAPSGIRPIGIGEVLRRIIGKAVITNIKPDLMESAGCLQLCAGQKAGCEAAAHAMRDIFDEEETDAVLFIDASNAFNTLNRNALLHNIGYLCPPMATYIRNCYQKPSRLFIAGGKELKSTEGATQGAPTAMPAYGVGILPLLAIIKPEEDTSTLKQMAYADDLGAGAKLSVLKQWWENIEEHGPSFGYHPKACKSWLVVKEDKYEEALRVFADTEIKITIDGRKYLGGFVGTGEGKSEYVGELVSDWIGQLEVLSEIAKSEPQAAYTAFTAGFQHKMTYFIRTIPEIAEVLKPLDDIIDEQLLPALTEGHVMSADDRLLLSLPVRFGGLGIPVYQEICVSEYENSRRATELLRTKIVAQDSQFEHNQVREREIEKEIKNARETTHKLKLDSLRTKMNDEMKRANDLAQMKGASSWLTSLPLREEGFVLNKREFFDAVAMRYRWDMKRLPLNCSCGKQFSMDHAIQCPLGGYVIRRHDQIRDLFASLLNDVANEVRIEPSLQPLSGEILNNGANCENDARLDVAARGFWQRCEMAFFDIRVFNPFAKSHLKTSLVSVFRSNEASKKRQYNNRVIQIEHGTFTPVVMSSFGGFGKETNIFVSKLVEKVAEKKSLERSLVASYIRTKVSFELIRAQVNCIRGSRSLWKKTQIDTGEIEVVQNSSNIEERR